MERRHGPWHGHSTSKDGTQLSEWSWLGPLLHSGTWQSSQHEGTLLARDAKHTKSSRVPLSHRLRRVYAPKIRSMKVNPTQLLAEVVHAAIGAVQRNDNKGQKNAAFVSYVTSRFLPS